MNLLHFKYALEVAREESFSKAAEKLYTGQPNLSRAIKELEGDLGIKILKRTSRGIIPPPEGKEFLSRAEKIMNDLYEIEKRFNTEH
ncbi:MAG: LysR family transcriptional regulator, partial [Oscillospiraceae bacterium]